MLLAQPLPFHDAAPSFLPAGTIFPDISNYLPVKFPQEKQNHGSDIEQGLVPQTTGGSLLNGVLTAVSAFGAEVEVRRAGRWEGKVGCSVASLGAQKAGGGGQAGLSRRWHGDALGEAGALLHRAEHSPSPGVRGAEGGRPVATESLQAWLLPHPHKVSPQTCDRR